MPALPNQNSVVLNILMTALLFLIIYLILVFPSPVQKSIFSNLEKTELSQIQSGGPLLAPLLRNLR